MGPCMVGRFAVSYTHLDVYKRQIVPKSIKVNNMLCFSSLLKTIPEYAASAGNLFTALSKFGEEYTFVDGAKDIWANDYICLLYTSRGTYDLILMDIMMPNIDGHQAAKAIRALGIERSDACLLYTSRCV